VGLSWQQGPLSAGAIGRFLVPEPLPKRLLYVEPLRRRMRVRFGNTWIADSEHALAGQTVIPHGPDRDLTVAEALPRKQA
jgi:hypothetical protein